MTIIKVVEHHVMSITHSFELMFISILSPYHSLTLIHSLSLPPFVTFSLLLICLFPSPLGLSLSFHLSQ